MGKEEELLGLLLFLLTDADLELLGLGFAIAFPVKPSRRFLQVRVHIRPLRQHGHDGGLQPSVGICDAQTANIGD